MKGFPRMKPDKHEAMRNATARMDHADVVLGQVPPDFSQARLNASHDRMDALATWLDSAPYRIFYSERGCLAKHSRELLEQAQRSLAKRLDRFVSQGKDTFTLTEMYRMQTGSGNFRCIVSVDGINYSWKSHDGRHWETDGKLKLVRNQ